MNILLVENNALTARLLKQQLAAHGASITTAVSAEEALVLLKSDGRWDALVTDVVLPGMSGLALLEEAVEHLPAKVVVTTGLSPAELNILDGIPCKVLYKPFTTNELLAALQEGSP